MLSKERILATPASEIRALWPMALWLSYDAYRVLILGVGVTKKTSIIAIIILGS